ncbi:hypothetical protein V6N11_041674 [Hibiscus sabdariffa]|uniref:Uncharacterized protein n=1 Tax=Hibiscus sabdariffa TaxID=183260 RepID=A0ABR2RLJ9_9ROSI
MRDCARIGGQVDNPLPVAMYQNYVMLLIAIHWPSCANCCYRGVIMEVHKMTVDKTKLMSKVKAMKIIECTQDMNIVVVTKLQSEQMYIRIPKPLS